MDSLVQSDSDLLRRSRPLTVPCRRALQLAQPIRLLLEYTGEKYEDKKYVCGPAPNYDKSCWFDIKEKMNLDFPNVSWNLQCIFVSR